MTQAQGNASRAASARERLKHLSERIDLFRDVEGLDDATLTDHCTWQQYPKNTQILSADDLTSDLFFVIEGAVTACNYSADGKEVSYIDIHEGGVFGEFSAIDGKPRSATVETTAETLIVRMTSDQFRSLMLKHPALGLRIAELLVAKIRGLTQRIYEFGTLSVGQRLLNELLRLCDAATIDGRSCVIEPAPTHYQIASRIATHREAVSRELKELVSAGIIEVGRQRIRVKDIERLRSLSQ